MTATQLETAARRRLNAVTSQFWSSDEIISECLFAAIVDVCARAKVYETTATATSVIGTADYTKPTGTIEIKRIKYDGQKLELIPEREFFAMNLAGTASPQGRPRSYFMWGSTYTLYPTPDEVKTISLQIVGAPTSVDSGTDISAIIPSQFHMRLVNGVVYYMNMKEAEDPRLPVFENRWLNVDLPSIVDEWRRSKHADKMPRVRTEETLLTNETGIV